MYPIGLEDYTQIDLETELDRRIKLRQQGKCDYCERPINFSPCKYFSRHSHGIIELEAEHRLARKSTNPENMNGYADQFGGSDYP